VLHVDLDCVDPERLAGFWCEALGYRPSGSGGAFVILEPIEQPGPPFLLQRVPEPKQGKNRMHVDIQTQDLASEAARLVGLGAAIVSPKPVEAFGLRWLTLRDPEGNEFDLCAPDSTKTSDH
jgi:predicted enzyme related to lactoylglutathione lyase